MDVSGAITILVIVIVAAVFVGFEHKSIREHRPPSIDKTKSAPHQDKD